MFFLKRLDHKNTPSHIYVRDYVDRKKIFCHVPISLDLVGNYCSHNLLTFRLINIVLLELHPMLPPQRSISMSSRSSESQGSSSYSSLNILL